MSKPITPSPTTTTFPIPSIIAGYHREEFDFTGDTTGKDPTQCSAVDGIIGPKTIAALHRFQSGCVMVKELLDETETDISEKKTDSHALKLTALASATSRKDDVRAIQARMRTAGFNPGPSDGILGPRTKSILVGVQSGCTLIRAFPETSQQIRMVQRQAAPALTSRKRIQPVALPSPVSGPSKNNSS